ncbi:MAG TPA: ion channel protein [Candidatus Limnocylindrales bacterium]|nr:ion channel protein [Candidatus Limnocylindrales bacterium]
MSSHLRRSSVRPLLALVIPGIVVGAASAVILIAVTAVATWLEDIVWTTIPTALGMPGDAPGWIVLVLTLTGLAVGAVVTFVPGHAGPDPATTGLAEPPMPPHVLPGLALALILVLAGGVSLGPENPILGINIGLAVAIGLRVLPGLPAAAWSGLAFAGTIGAMFGTPLAAALLLSEQPGDPGRPLWDRLFGPLVAAGAGTMTMLLLSGESFVLDVAPYASPQPIDLVSGSLIAVAVAAAGMAAVYAFPLVHAAFRRLGRPLVSLLVGGLVLGVLGVLGGPISLFKGLEQMKELTERAAEFSPAALVLLGVIKLVALLVASGSGFRGGRIFPSVFAAVALGLFFSALFPAVPQAVALAASLVGMIVAITRSGWLAIFMGGLMVGDPAIIPLLAIIVLPAWLVVTGRPEMIVRRAEATPA